MPDPDAVLTRLTDRLAPLERELHQAYWTAATQASPRASAPGSPLGPAFLAGLAA
jgi:hypothetical protein